MRNIIIGTTTGAIVGAALSMIVPCNEKKLKNKILSKSECRKIRSKIIKRLAGLVYKVI